MAVDFLDISKGSSGALVNLHVDASQLTLRLLNGTHQSALDLLMALFDEKGKVAASFVERINVNIRPERLDTARKNGFSYRRLMALKPGFYQARVAIREEGSARMGSASKWVEVSDVGKQQLTLSGVLLGGQGSPERFAAREQRLHTATVVGDAALQKGRRDRFHGFCLQRKGREEHRRPGDPIAGLLAASWSTPRRSPK